MVRETLKIFIVIALVVTAGCSQIQERRRPNVVVDPEVWNFGTIERGETVKGRVTIRNYTDTTFSISVHSTCDCLRASTDKDVLRPRGETQINLSYLGDVIKERVSKTVFVKLNGTTPRQLKIDVTGTVIPGEKPHLSILPNPIPIERSKGTSNLLEISNLGQEELAIDQIRCYGCKTNAVSLKLGSGEKAVIVVDLLTQWEGKRWLEIESNDPVTPLRKIAIIELP